MGFTKRDLAWVLVLLVVAGFASGLAAGPAPAPAPQRDGILARAVRWLPWVAPLLLRDEGPPPATPADNDVEALYQTLPDYVINAPIEREMTAQGVPLLDHGKGW